MKRLIWFMVLGVWWPVLAQAHFLIAVDPKGLGYGVRGQEAHFLLLLGHPFEGILYDLKAPEGFVLTPAGEKEKVVFSRLTIKDYASGKKRFGYRLTYLPTRRGDHWICLKAKPYLNEETNQVWQDYLKVPLHVQVERGWEQSCGFGLEIEPLVRPYGLQTGQVFRGRVLLKGQPYAGAEIEVEKFNGFYVPPSKLPQDSWGRINNPRLTQVLRTDETGYFTVGFPEAGWWVINVSVPGGQARYAQRTFPLVIRSGIWIYVFPAQPVPPTGLDLKPEGP